MIGIYSIRKFDVLSIMLFVVTCVSLSVAMSLAANPATAAIPDRALNRIRGSNPMVRQVVDHSCTWWNVYTQNVFNPPGTYTVVSYNNSDKPNCGTAGVPGGTACINCSNLVNVYTLQQGGGPPGVQNNNPTTQNCDVNPMIGTCSGTLCVDPTIYAGCSTTGPVYPSQ